MKTIPYGRQHITEEDIAEVTKVLRSDFLTQGPTIFAFEQEFAKYIGSKYAIAVANGTAALHLCTLALGVTKGVNVITSTITFAASANCVKYANGEVYFADIDPETNTLSYEATKQLILSKPKGFFSGIIPVDLAGYPLNTERFRQLADEHNLWIIEDACHAPGAFFVDSRGVKQNSGNGAYAELSIFSFHPVKHIACGEGGMITTNDASLYQIIMMLRTHGITKDPELMKENHEGWYYEMQVLGYNYRLTDFQAALGLSQLKRAEQGLARRREIAAKYAKMLGQNKSVKSQSGVVDGHAYHLYIIRVDRRKELYDFLKTKNIFCQVHYIPVHILPYYKELGFKKGDYPKAELYYEECLSLPMYPTLTDEEQTFVIDSINLFYNA